MRENKTWEPKSTAFLSNQLKQGDNFVDCGAHWGYFSLFASRKIGEKGRVYAIEPNLRSFMFLVMNLSINDTTNIRPLNVALWNNNTQLDLWPETATTGGSHVVGVWQNTSRGVKVNGVALDSIFEPNDVDYIKIDCEGSDAIILSGATRILIEGKPKLMIEHPNQPFLETLGYKMIKRFPDEQTWFFEKG